MKKQASWQLPRGVSRGTWDYSQTHDIATSYDSYFGDHGLFRLDEEVVRRWTSPDDSVIDLGCGTGRAVMPLLERGLDCVACDLSHPMLKEVNAKANQLAESGNLMSVRANLVDLRCFADASFDCALCLFSTLGMIRGHVPRMEVLRHVARMLKPGGLFIFQVHNYWVHLFDPEGPWWMLQNAARTLLRRDVQLGDRFYPYRGIPDMYLHSFSRRSIGRMLRDTGFEVEEMIALNSRQSGTLPCRWLWSGLRASGWIIVARATLTHVT